MSKQSDEGRGREKRIRGSETRTRRCCLHEMKQTGTKEAEKRKTGEEKCTCEAATLSANHHEGVFNFADSPEQQRHIGSVLQ